MEYRFYTDAPTAALSEHAFRRSADEPFRRSRWT